MQSIIQPADPPLPPPVPLPLPPADLIHELTAKILRVQSDAIDILHQVMLQSAAAFTKPPQEDLRQARLTAQQMRISLRSATQLLNLRLPSLPGDNPRPARNHPSPPRPALATPTPQPAPPANQPHAPAHPATQILATAQRANTILAAAGTVSSGAERMKTGSEAATQSVSPPSRFGERITSPLTPDASSPTPPSPPHVSPSFTPQASRLAPPRPPDLTETDLALLTVRKAGIYVPISFELASLLRLWHVYTDATGIKPPFEITAEQLLPPPRRRRRRTRFAPFATGDTQKARAPANDATGSGNPTPRDTNHDGPIAASAIHAPDDNQPTHPTRGQLSSPANQPAIPPLSAAAAHEIKAGPPRDSCDHDFRTELRADRISSSAWLQSETSSPAQPASCRACEIS